MNNIKVLPTAALILLTYACSHPIEIVGEGDVWSTGGRTCTLEDYQDGLSNCSENYVIGAYQETYYAEPRENWVFDHWGNYCVDATDNSCSFDISANAVKNFWGQTMPALQAVFIPDSGESFPNILGNYIGSYAITVNNCSDPESNGTCAID